MTHYICNRRRLECGMACGGEKEIEALNKRLDLHERMLKVLLRGPHHPTLMKRIEELGQELKKEKEED